MQFLRKEPMSHGRATLSVAMIARDEEAILSRTLESVRWADEIVIVDSGSTDRTPEIAASYSAEHFFHRDFRGHAEQKNIAIDKCTSEWILLLDADETVSPELADEIQDALKNPQYGAYWMPRLNLFLNRWLRHGGFYPDRKLRLFKRGAARVEEGAGPHGTVLFNGPTGRFRNNLMHYAYPSLDLYIEHMNRYSSEVADTIAAKGEARSSLFAFVGTALLNPAFTFLKNYIFRFGFLDGTAGLLLHLNHSFYVHWKYSKAWEAGVRQRTGQEPVHVHPDIKAGLRARPPGRE
jgi:glycosyltransferase involved in cell wall biosynthesis